MSCVKQACAVTMSALITAASAAPGLGLLAATSEAIFCAMPVEVLRGTAGGAAGALLSQPVEAV